MNRSSIIETYCSIEGFDNYYVSNFGRVRNFKTNKILKATKDQKGYHRIKLTQNGILKTFKVHRLVATYFLKKVKGLNMVNHKDCNKENNHLTNLEWSNNSLNQKHAFKNGLQNNKGENSPTSKLKEYQVKEIREKFLPRVYTRKMLSKEYNVSPATIKDIVLRRTWTEI